MESVGSLQREWVWEESVWRVPKLTSLRIDFSMLRELISRSIAAVDG